MGVFRKRRRPASIRREAMTWIDRLAKPSVTEDEKAECKAWLDSAPENPREFLLASALLDLQSQQRGSPRIHSILERLDVVPEATDAADAARDSLSLPRRSLRRRAYAGVAAAGVAVIAIVAATAMLWPKPAPSYATGVGENRKIVLEDGSTIQLNTDSHVRMTFTSHRREAHLFRGEALFDVSYDAQRPFDVVTQCGTLRALSTTFVVYARPNGTCDLIVESGRVRASSSAAHETVSTHQIAFLGNRLDVHPLTVAELQRRLAWTQGLLMFENTRLADAVAQFNRYNKTQLVVDPRLQNLAIGGRFIATRAREFAMALTAVRVRAIESPSAKGNVIWLTPQIIPPTK
jgi:transmembrane sensor